jgi:hypothetical protein
MKQSNEQIYMGLMALRANEPKRYYFLRLQEKYDLIMSALERKNKAVLCERVNDLNDFIKSRSGMYGITAPELKQYFCVNNMSLNFKL